MLINNVLIYYTIGRGAQGAIRDHDESQDQTAIWPHATRHTEETRNNQ